MDLQLLVPAAVSAKRDGTHTQFNNYIADIMEEEINDAMHFWGLKLTLYSIAF